MSTAAGGVLLPFLIAAAIKTLQGSSLVAAITAAGMVQPILLPLGLAGTNGKALAALAIGAGAMTDCACQRRLFLAGDGPRRANALARTDALSVGTLLQGLVAAVALCLTALLFYHA